MPDETVEVELERLRDENYKTIYSNWVQAGRTPWDVALVFGNVREIQPGETAILELINVTLTPALAKALINTLAATVKEYERENGEIQIPASLRRLAEERRQRLSSATSASESPSASASPSPESVEEEA